MKTLLTIALMSFFSFVAQAQSQTDAMYFTVASYQKTGCLGLAEVGLGTSYNALGDYPKIVRFLYSSESPTAVNESSKNFETTISDDGTALEMNGELCGLESGKRYYFKVELLTADSKELFITPDSSYDETRHSAIVP
jgi:hypothetical protein